MIRPGMVGAWSEGNGQPGRRVMAGNLNHGDHDHGRPGFTGTQRFRWEIGADAALTPEVVGEALSKFIAQFPKYNPPNTYTSIYPRASLAAAWSSMVDLSKAVLEQLAEALNASSPSEILQILGLGVIPELAEAPWRAQLEDALKRAMVASTDYAKYASVLSTHVDPLIEPTFKDDTVSLLLSLKAVLETLQDVEQFRPWWLQAAQKFVDTVDFVLKLTWKLVKDIGEAANYVANNAGKIIEYTAIGLGGLLVISLLRKG